MNIIKFTLRILERVTDWTGRVSSFLVVIMIGLLAFEAVSRYVFDRPTVWATESTSFAFVIYIMLGGAYAQLHKIHVNVDVVVIHLSPRVKAILQLFGLIFLFLFGIILTWQGIVMAQTAWQIKETTWSLWGGPVYIIKTFIPIGAFLLLVQGLNDFMRILVFDVVRKEV